MTHESDLHRAESPNALADRIDKLVYLAEYPEGSGDWHGAIALSLDPATLCPPELKPVVRKELTDQGIRPAAQFYAWAAKRNDNPAERVEYAEEALRLAPTWDKAQNLVEALRADEGQ